MRRRMTITIGAALLALAVSAPAVADHGKPGSNKPGHSEFGRATLTGFASLPALTFVPGSEPSGAQLGTAPINGVIPPFVGQPVQGFSGIVGRQDGTFDVLSDNGYGSQNNSADFLLRVHRVKPDFKRGKVAVLGRFGWRAPTTRSVT